MDRQNKKKPLEFLAEIMQEDQAVRTVPERSRIRPDHPSHHIMVAQANGHLVPRNTTRLAIDADRGPCDLGVATVGGMVLLLHMEQDQGKPSLARRQFLT